jgi:mannose-6-phosphate isomerase-like protein (cupin superfamily)
MSDLEGGDAACWAHLVEDVAGADVPAHDGVVAVNVPALAEGSTEVVPWSTRSADLNVNLLHFRAGDGVAAHVNTEVDVLLVGVSGEGEVLVGEAIYPLGVGRVVLIPKALERSIRATSDHLSYLSCHRARRGLMPAPLLPGEGKRDR